MSVLGTRVVRKEDPRLLRGEARYVADLDETDDPRLVGLAHVVFVRSTVAHATIAELDVAEALEAPGVIGVYTHADLDLEAPPVMGGMLGPDVVRPFLADGRVRYVGEPVAVVVAESVAEGVDAAELVFVDYDLLEPVIGVEAAVGADTLLFPAHGSNVVSGFGAEAPEDLFDGCDVIVRHRIVNQRLAPAPIEPRGCVAVWGGDDGVELTFWTSTQTAHGVRSTLADRFGLDHDAVRVIAPDVGGGFGGKMNLYPDELITAWVARRTGRPARWIETRTESMLGIHHGRDQVHELAIGGTRDGRVLAYHLDVLQDAGAYPDIGAFLPYFTRLMAQGTYDIARVSCRTRSVVTTTTPTAAYRGAGRPEAAAAIERAMDLFAAEVDLDPVEVRRRNLIPADAFPYTTQTGATYDCGNYPRALALAVEAAGYDDLRAEQARRRAAGDPVAVGIGVACYVEITAGPGAGEKEFARITIDPDGSATVFTGSSAHGQGHATAWSMIVHDLTGIPMDRVEVVHGDTAKVEAGVGTYGSRSLQVGGSALHRATSDLVARGVEVAAKLLDVDEAEVALDIETGTFSAESVSGEAVGWDEVVRLSGEPFTEAHEFVTETPTYPFGAHIAVVEVDTETGQARLVRLVAVDDAGRILNPLIVEGQRHGGIAQGVAQALVEEVRYDADGNPQTANLADYGLISTMELPAAELVPMETPTPVNPLGAKGIGESGTIGATPAVQNAVIDAVAHLGVRHLDLPCTAERVWHALELARAEAG